MAVGFGKKARDKEWGFTEASLPRFFKGSGTGVLVCHGFGCTPSTMRCLYDRAVGMGLSASLPLLTGHAETFGDLDRSTYEDWRRDVEEAYSKLVEAGAEKIILCGLSLGALLMADLAAKHEGDGKLAGVFLICPPVKMKGYLNFCADIAPLIPFVQTADGFKTEGTELYYGMATRKLRDIRKMAKLALEGVGNIKAPVMLIEAGNDNRVDPKSYGIMMKKIPAARHIVIDGAPHGIPYSDHAPKLCDIFEGFLTTITDKRR
ncbi:MAG: alpha/beta fold hydrolase [Clostridia bacterium]|nr:alpha/beta fold hydrolase [Clostridia bacterium]